MTEVIKRDKRREAFDADKLRRSIESAAKEAGLEEKRVREITNKIANPIIEMAQKETEVESRVLRERALTELDNVEPSVSQA